MSAGGLREATGPEAHQWVWAGTTWKTVADTAKAAGVPISEVEAWICDRRVFALQRDGVLLMAAYEFGEDGMPLAMIGRVIAEFNGTWSDMGIAAFFESRSGFLGGARPREIAASEPDRVAAAAKFNADAVRHP